MKVLLVFAAAGVLFAQNPETAAFPSAVATDKTLFVASTATTTLSAAITTTSQTSLSVGSSTNFLVPTVVKIDSEMIAICSKGTGTLTVCTVASDGFDGRGFSGTTAATHLISRTVTVVVDRAFHNRMAAELKALETAVQGVTTGASEGLLLAGAEQAAPTVTEPTCYIDSTSHLFTCKNASNAVTGAIVNNPATSSSTIGDGVLVVGDGGTRAIKAASGLSGVATLSSGVVSVVSGTSSNCVKVDGSSGSCGGGTSDWITAPVTTHDHDTGSYSESVTVTIGGCSGGTKYYSEDGSTVSAYSDPLVITTTGTVLQSRCEKAGYEPSAAKSSTYTITSASLYFDDGFENAGTFDASKWTTSDSPAIVTSGAQYAGTYAAQISDTADRILHTDGTGWTNGATIYARMYLKWSARLDSTRNACWYVPGSDTSIDCFGFSGANHTLDVWVNGTADSYGSATLAVDTWYRVETKLVLNTTGGSFTVRVYTAGTDTLLDEVTFTNLNTNAANATLTALRFMSADATANLTIDNVAIDTAGWIGQ